MSALLLTKRLSAGYFLPPAESRSTVKPSDLSLFRPNLFVNSLLVKTAGFGSGTDPVYLFWICQQILCDFIGLLSFLQLRTDQTD